MINVMIVDDFKVFITQLKKLDVWKNFSDRFELRYTFTDSYQALETLRRENIDVLMTDIKMPVLGGLDLLRIVKKEKLCRYTVLMSEYADFEFAHEAIVLGAFDYMVKPVSGPMMNMLLERIYTDYVTNPDDSDEEVDDIIVSGVKNLWDSILKCSDDFTSEAGKLMTACRNKSGENIIRYGIILSHAAGMIYKYATDSFPWIIGITFDSDNLSRELNGSDSIFISESLFTGFCSDLFVAVKTYHPYGINKLIENAVDYVLANYSQKLKLSDVADICYVNQSHLSHSFKVCMGISFVDYVVQYKMHLLKIMISRTDSTISEMADKLGYIDVKYMSRLFKNTFGITISEYKCSLTGM